MAIPRISAEFCCSQRQHRPEALAAAIDEVVSKFWDHLDVGHRLVENNTVDGFEVVGNEVEKRL